MPRKDLESRKEYTKEYYPKYRKRLREEGKDPRSPSAIVKDKKKYGERKEAGLCVSCGHREPRQGKVQCEPCATRASQYQKDMYSDGRERPRRIRTKQSRLGMTPDAIDEMLLAQNYECLICKSGVTYRSTLDHCHDTGIVRGMLCRKCNTGIGMLLDNPILTERATHYLRTQGRMD